MHCYPTFSHSHVQLCIEAGSETSHSLAYSHPINFILAGPCLSALYYARITCRGRRTTWSRPWPTASGRTRRAGAPPEASSCNEMGNGCKKYAPNSSIDQAPSLPRPSSCFSLRTDASRSLAFWRFLAYVFVKILPRFHFPTQLTGPCKNLCQVQ